MRLLTWNIQHGGGKRVPAICTTIKDHDPDIAVLTEYQEGPNGEALRTRLATSGCETG